MANRYDPLYVAFLHAFNIERDYYECHEVMEELWLSEGRSPLWQGLLQIAVGLYHHERGNCGGAIKLLTAALEKLEPRSEASIGIDLEKLLREAKSYLHGLLHEGERFPFRPFFIEITDHELAAAVQQFSAAQPPHEGGFIDTPPKTV